MIELSQEFVPAVDNQARLRGSDPESILFQKFSEQGHYAGRRHVTRQGTYLCSPGGTLLASVAPGEPEELLAAMRRALEQWRALPATERRLPPGTKVGSPPSYRSLHPEDGLVLSVFSRDLVRSPRDGEEFDRNAVEPGRCNLDYAWFTRDEARCWLPEDPADGRRHGVPGPLVSRLVQFHLVDAVSGGLPRSFLPSEIDGSWIASEVLEREGPHVRIRLEGSSRASAPERELREGAREIDTLILGHATYDLMRESFVDFEIVAVGTRSGFLDHTTGLPAEPRAIGFVLSLAPPGHAVVPPHFLHRYGAEWAVASR